MRKVIRILFKVLEEQRKSPIHNLLASQYDMYVHLNYGYLKYSKFWLWKSWKALKIKTIEILWTYTKIFTIFFYSALTTIQVLYIKWWIQ